MQPGCRARRRTAPRPAVGPPPARARPARCSNFTWPRGCGVRPAPAIPRGSRAARSRAGKGPGPDNPAAAARTHQSAVPPPEPGLHSELHGPTAPGLSGAPCRTTPHAAAPTTPPPARPRPRPRPLPAGGPAGSGGGLSPGSANQGRLTSRFTRIGERLGQWGNGSGAEPRRRGAEGCGEGGSAFVLRPGAGWGFGRCPFQSGKKVYFGPSLL